MTSGLRSCWETRAVAAIALAFLALLPTSAAAAPPAAAALADPPLPEGAIARIGAPLLPGTQGNAVLFSPDGNVLAAFGQTRARGLTKWDNSVAQFWDVRARRRLHKRDAAAGVAFAPDGKRVAIASRASVGVYAWPVGWCRRCGGKTH